MAITTNELNDALRHAQNGDWENSHKIVQRDDQSELVCWLHAVLHKIEGDADNSRYWYRRTNHEYEDFTDPQHELRAIADAVA